MSPTEFELVAAVCVSYTLPQHHNNGGVRTVDKVYLEPIL